MSIVNRHRGSAAGRAALCVLLLVLPSSPALAASSSAEQAGLLLNRAKQESSRGNYEEADRNCEMALGLGLEPRVRYPVYLEKGAISLVRNRYEEAIDCFQRAAGLFPRREEAKLLLARAYEVSELYELARRTYLDILERDRDSFRANKGLGSLYLKQGLTTNAYECYRRALAVRPDAEIYRNMASCAEQTGDMPMAEAMLCQILPGERTYDDHLALGRLFESQERPGEAETSYSQAIRLDPARPEGYVCLGLLHLKGNNLTHAEKLLLIAREKVPGDAAVGFMLADVYYRQHDLGKALEEIQRVSRTAKSRLLAGYGERFERYLRTLRPPAR